MGFRDGKMEFDPIKLEALLDLLVQSGVEEFEGYGMHVRFTSAMFTPDRVAPRENNVVEIQESQDQRQINSVWDDPNLWPGGKKPQFPSK